MLGRLSMQNRMLGLMGLLMHYRHYIRLELVCNFFGPTIWIPWPSSEYISMCVATCPEQLAVFHFYIFPAQSNSRQCERWDAVRHTHLLYLSLSSLHATAFERAIHGFHAEKLRFMCSMCIRGSQIFVEPKAPCHSPKLFTNTNWFFNLYKLAHIDTFYNNRTF